MDELNSLIIPIGEDRVSPEDYTRILTGPQSCFEKRFAKTASECRECLAPVIVQGALFFLRDLCRARKKGFDTPTLLTVLTTEEVSERLSLGQSVDQIFLEVLGKADLELWGAEARAMLALRLSKITDPPELPHLKELAQHVPSQKDD